MAHRDLGRDAGAGVVAELGLGIHTASRPDGEVREAEQAQGTCHVGFGHNLAYGGANESAFHGDFCVLRPTTTLDGVVICQEGCYILPPDVPDGPG